MRYFNNIYAKREFFNLKILQMNNLYTTSAVPVALALGSNIGNGAETFLLACNLLQENGFVIEKRSGNIVTKPVDCPAGTPDFINSALIGRFAGTPQELLQITRSIEVALGRPADHGFHESRTIDLDIIIFGDTILDVVDLQLPHPRAQQRCFVLEPLAQIAPDWIFPDTGQSVAGALRKLKN